jgi:hypothetical protein
MLYNLITPPAIFALVIFEIGFHAFAWAGLEL